MHASNNAYGASSDVYRCQKTLEPLEKRQPELAVTYDPHLSEGA